MSHTFLAPEFRYNSMRLPFCLQCNCTLVLYIHKWLSDHRLLYEVTYEEMSFKNLFVHLWQEPSADYRKLLDKQFKERSTQLNLTYTVSTSRSNSTIELPSTGGQYLARFPTVNSVLVEVDLRVFLTKPLRKCLSLCHAPQFPPFAVIFVAGNFPLEDVPPPQVYDISWR